MVTIFREPLARTISHFQYFKEFKEDLSKSAQSSKDYTKDKVLKYNNFTAYRLGLKIVMKMAKQDHFWPFLPWNDRSDQTSPYTGIPPLNLAFQLLNLKF